MAFGLLTTKFQIFRKPLRVKLQNLPDLIRSCLLVHNYIIDERLLKDPDYIIQKEEISEMVESKFGFLPSEPTNEERRYLPEVNNIKILKTINKKNGQYFRENLVSKINEYGISLPAPVVERRIRENYIKRKFRE